MAVKEPLKYLFIAEFADGSCIEQDENDTSVLDPEKRTTWYDVEQRFLSGKPEDQVLKFTLLPNPAVEQDVSLHSLDLTTLIFTLDLIQFYTHDTGRDDPLLFNPRPIYFRRVSRHFTQSSPDSKPEPAGVDITYRLGWQANDSNGKNYQRIIEFV